MTKQEFMAMCLPYNLKIKHFDANRESEHICKIEVWHNEEVTISDGEYEYDLLLNDILPILHPLSDLTKEIEHKGERFVPIIELAKFLYKRISIAGSFKLIEDRVYFESISSNQFWYSKEMKCFCSMFENSDIPVHNQLQLFQQLLKWHFDLITEDCEKVFVTDDFNPYK